MPKVIDDDIHEIDVRLFLEDMTPEQAETLLGGCCQSSQSYPHICMVDIAEIMNNAKKPTGGDDKKYSNQKINTIDNSKKTYLNGVPLTSKGKTLVIYIKE
jgi:hypothetical protein